MATATISPVDSDPVEFTLPAGRVEILSPERRMETVVAGIHSVLEKNRRIGPPPNDADPAVQPHTVLSRYLTERDNLPDPVSVEEKLQLDEVQLRRLERGRRTRELHHRVSFLINSPIGLEYLSQVYDTQNLSTDDGRVIRDGRTHALVIAKAAFDAAREPTKEGMAVARGDTEGVIKSLEDLRKALGESDSGKQYCLMQATFARNPELYLAAMEKLTYGITPDISADHLQHKTSQILYKLGKSVQSVYRDGQDRLPELVPVLDQFAEAILKEYIDKLPDTHATTLMSMLKMSENGSMNPSIDHKPGNIKADSFKTAGSLGVYSYLGSYARLTDSNIYIEIDPDFLDSAQGSFYLSEDFVPAPVFFEAKPDGRAVMRTSFTEKLSEVMNRGDAKKFLATKVAARMIDNGIKNGVPIDQLPEMVINPLSVFTYLIENSHLRPQDLDIPVGGRPEGHHPFPVPLDKCTVRVPGVNLKEYWESFKSRREEKMRSMVDNGEPVSETSYISRSYEVLKEALTEPATQDPDISLARFLTGKFGSGMKVIESDDGPQTDFERNKQYFGAAAAAEVLPPGVSENALRSIGNLNFTKNSDGTLTMHFMDHLSLIRFINESIASGEESPFDSVAQSVDRSVFLARIRPKGDVTSGEVISLISQMYDGFIDRSKQRRIPPYSVDKRAEHIYNTRSRK